MPVCERCQEEFEPSDGDEGRVYIVCDMRYHAEAPLCPECSDALRSFMSHTRAPRATDFEISTMKYIILKEVEKSVSSTGGISLASLSSEIWGYDDTPTPHHRVGDYRRLSNRVCDLAKEDKAIHDISGHGTCMVYAPGEMFEEVLGRVRDVYLRGTLDEVKKAVELYPKHLSEFTVDFPQYAGKMTTNIGVENNGN